MSKPKHIFFLMNHVFWGFAISFIFGFITAGYLWLTMPIEIFNNYHHAFFVSFNAAISGGLIFGAALLVYKTQDFVPNLLEECFSDEINNQPEYIEQRTRYLSPRRSITFASEFIVIGFVIFYFAKFPLVEISQNLMIFFACMQYACGVYVGRKLFYIAQLLNSVENVNVSGEVFKSEKLDGISNYVNALSVITIIFVYVHVISYFQAPFEYSTVSGVSVKIFLILPAILATPVVILFNFYPKSVLRKIYTKSINMEIKEITEKFRDFKISEYERLSYLIEYDKIKRDELKHRLRVTLGDLTVGIPILISVIAIIIQF